MRSLAASRTTERTEEEDRTVVTGIPATWFVQAKAGGRICIENGGFGSGTRCGGRYVEWLRSQLAALKALQQELLDAQRRLENSQAVKDRDLAKSQIKHMDELIAKYKDTRGYKKRIKEWKAEKRKNEKRADNAVKEVTQLTRAIREIRNELDAADVALRRCLGEPHIQNGALCWCGDRGIHAAGTPR